MDDQMSNRLREIPKDYSEDAPRDVPYNIPSMTVGTLASMMAIAKRVICDGEPGANRGFRVGPPRASLSDRCEGCNELTQARARLLLGIKVHAQFTVRSLGSRVEHGL